MLLGLKEIAELYVANGSMRNRLHCIVFKFFLQLCWFLRKYPYIYSLKSQNRMVTILYKRQS